MAGGVMNVPGLGAFLQAQQIGQQQQGSEISGLATLLKLKQAQEEQPVRMDLLKAQTTNELAKPEDRRNAQETTRQMALARLQQAAGQFEQTMQLKARGLTNAEDKAAWEREYQQGRLALEGAARQQGADRLFYDTGIRSPAPGVPTPAAAPPAAPAGGLEALLPGKPSLDPASVSASINSMFPLSSQASAAAEGADIRRRELLPNGGGMLPSSAVLGPSAPTATVAPANGIPAAGAPMPPAPAVAPLPQMPEFVGSPREQAAARNKWLLDRAKPGGGGGESGDYTKTGDAFLETIPQSDRTLIKKIANYDIDPKTLSTRGGQRERILSMASQYDPTFDQKNYNATAQAISRFATGPQGNTVRSLNVAIEHMDTARRLGDALKNTDLPLFNQVANEFATQTGRPAPTSFNAVKEIVADEVIKGVIGGAGALQDREAAAKKIRDASSPAQMNAVFDSWTELLGGQLKGLERQYEGSTRRTDFKDRYLTGRARDALSVTTNAPAGMPPSPARTRSGATVSNW